MDFEHLRYERRGPVTVIAIDRPERMNAIDGDTAAELVRAWSAFRDDDEALVGILTGTGERAFSAGGDLKASFDGNPPIEITPEEIAAHDRGERDGVLGPTRWTDVGKPTIAAVNGVAYAGGLEWACWTDMAIADAHASFGVTCRRWNIGLADGGTQRLPRIVGFRRAMEMIVTGRVIDAEEALSIGLVNEVVPSGSCLARAEELARAIAELPQPALRTDREAAIRGFGLPLDEGLLIEAQCFNRSIADAATIEGLRRFNERDHPDRGDAHPATPGIVRKQRS
jgi:enoyl-CoA hydratase